MGPAWLVDYFVVVSIDRRNVKLFFELCTRMKFSIEKDCDDFARLMDYWLHFNFLNEFFKCFTMRDGDKMLKCYDLMHVPQKPSFEP